METEAERIAREWPDKHTLGPGLSLIMVLPCEESPEFPAIYVRVVDDGPIPGEDFIRDR